MKLSKETVNILRNFATINGNLVVKAGQTLKTIAEAKNIMASAEVTESFPTDFGIYDLSQFLGSLELIEDAELKFDAESVQITNSASKVQYYYSSPDVLTAPTKDIQMPDADVQIALSDSQLSQIRKAAGTLGHNVLSLIAKDGAVTANILDPKDSTSNVYSLSVGDCNDELDCSCNFLISNLKLISGDYVVKVSSKLISEWENKTQKAKYWVALEKDSAFN